MIKVIFHGRMAEDIGFSELKLECSTFREIVRAVEINSNGKFSALMKTYSGEGVNYIPRIDNKEIDKQFLTGCIDTELKDGQEIHIMPTMGQNASAVIMIVLTVVSIALQLVSMLLTKRPKLDSGSSDTSETRRKENYLFDGKSRPISQGNPVPVGYGRIMAAAMPINTYVKYADLIGSSFGDPYYYSFRIIDTEKLTAWANNILIKTVGVERASRFFGAVGYVPTTAGELQPELNAMHYAFVAAEVDKAIPPFFGQRDWGSIRDVIVETGGSFGDSNGKGDKWATPLYNGGRYMFAQRITGMSNMDAIYASSLRSERIHSHGNDTNKDAYGYQTFVLLPRYFSTVDDISNTTDGNRAFSTFSDHYLTPDSYTTDHYQRTMMGVMRMFKSPKTSQLYVAPANFTLAFRFFSPFVEVKADGGGYPNDVYTYKYPLPDDRFGDGDPRRRGPLFWDVTIDFFDDTLNGNLLGVVNDNFRRRLNDSFNTLEIAQAALLNPPGFKSRILAAKSQASIFNHSARFRGTSGFCTIVAIPQFKPTSPKTKPASFASFMNVAQQSNDFKNYYKFITGIDDDEDGIKNLEDAGVTAINIEYDCQSALVAVDEALAASISNGFGSTDEEFIPGKFVSFYLNNGPRRRRLIAVNPVTYPPGSTNPEPFLPSGSWTDEDPVFMSGIWGSPEIGKSDQAV